MAFTSIKNDILKGVYDGKYSLKKLPKPLYEATLDRLTDNLDKGFGDCEDEELRSDLTDNIVMFSAAKTFQQINELTDAILDNDLTKYLILASVIYDRYNDAWLKTEEDTTEWASRSAANWSGFKDSDEENPYLMYETSGGDKVCEICAPLDGILIDMNNSFWDDNATPQHFFCECLVKQVFGISSEAKNSIKNMVASTPEQIKKAIERSHKHKNPLFNYNPYKERVIFLDKGKNKHPYFDIPEKYKKLAEKNFNLPI